MSIKECCKYLLLLLFHPPKILIICWQTLKQSIKVVSQQIIYLSYIRYLPIALLIAVKEKNINFKISKECIYF